MLALFGPGHGMCPTLRVPLVPRLQGTAALQGRERLWGFDHRIWKASGPSAPCWTMLALFGPGQGMCPTLRLLLVPRLQGTAALQGQERLWSFDHGIWRASGPSAPRQRRMLLIARSITSSPRPFSTALSAHRLNPIVCSIFIVGGIESSIRFTTTSTRAGPLC